MATDIVQSLFGVTPEAYQRQQDVAAQARAMQFASMDPMQQATYGIFRGAGQLGGALGRALGGEDPELARITARQQIASQIDYSDPASIQSAIRMLQPIDPQGAMMLQTEADKARQRAQETQLNVLKTEDYLTKRGQAMQAAGLEKLASDLAGKIRNPDGTLNQEVVNELKSFPQGLAAISAQAKIVPELRRLGAVATPEVDPFTPFITDTTIPKNVQTYANQLSKSFASGSLDPETVNTRVKELAEMTQRTQQFEQNQQRIKANEETMAELRRQGLENSRQGLAIQRQNADIASQNVLFQQEMKRAEADRKAEEKRNKPLPSYLAKEEQADYEKAQATTNLASDAYAFINKIKAGEIPFGLKEKVSIRARQIAGSNAPDVLAREDYDRFVLRLVNESLRLNKGTQTNFDFENALKELQSSESPEAAAATMKRLVDVNLRATENAAKAVSDRRKNANFPEPANPIEVPKFDVQIINNADYQSFLKNPKYPSGTVFVDPKGVKRMKP